VALSGDPECESVGLHVHHLAAVTEVPVALLQKTFTDNSTFAGFPRWIKPSTPSPTTSYIQSEVFEHSDFLIKFTVVSIPPHYDCMLNVLSLLLFSDISSSRVYTKNRWYDSLIFFQKGSILYFCTKLYLPVVR